MRSNLITVVTTVASALLVAPVAVADAVQEQLRLMEQRMAEMEDRLQATSDELRSARATVETQQGLLTDAGLIESEDKGLRSSVGSFFEMVDVDGVAAASYNYRFIDRGDNDGGNTGARNDTYFTHPNGDAFQIDQLWITVDKTPTEESRGGFHADFVWGETADSQVNGSGNNSDGTALDSGMIYTAYASWLAPIGNGVQIDAGRLATVLGAEVLKANANFNVTNGVVFQNLQPFTHAGVSFTTALNDSTTLVAGVVNNVYNDANFSVDRDKAGYAQLQFAGDSFGLNVGAIVGEDGAQNRCDASETDCNTSVVDVVASVSPTDAIEAWVNFDWVRYFGSDVKDGDKFGIAGAARVAVAENTRLATRVEYLHENSVTRASNAQDDRSLVTVTGTLDQEVAEGVHIRGELRWDKELETDDFTSQDDDQLVGLLEMYYEF